MSQVNKEKILDALRKVSDGDSEKDIVSSGIVSSIVIRGKRVGFSLEVDSNEVSLKENLRKDCEDVVRSIAGVDEVTVVLTAAKSDSENDKTQSSARRIPGIKKIIVVASGKGGVGKSTVAVSLAHSLKMRGFKVGVLDSDIYGPSVPMMMGINKKPETDSAKKLIPLEKNDIKLISMGFLIDSDKAAIWRGSMASKALYQLFLGVNWGDLDYLVVDTPPGTGDIHLSMLKNFVIDGVVMVSAPQLVAVEDVKKAYSMYKKLNIPVIGVIENMSYFENEEKNYIYGQGNTEKFAKKENLKFLGELPINPDVSKSLDKGKLELDNNLLSNSMVDEILRYE